MCAVTWPRSGGQPEAQETTRALPMLRWRSAGTLTWPRGSSDRHRPLPVGREPRGRPGCKRKAAGSPGKAGPPRAQLPPHPPGHDIHRQALRISRNFERGSRRDDHCVTVAYTRRPGPPCGAGRPGYDQTVWTITTGARRLLPTLGFGTWPRTRAGTVGAGQAIVLCGSPDAWSGMVPPEANDEWPAHRPRAVHLFVRPAPPAVLPIASTALLP